MLRVRKKVAWGIIFIMGFSAFNVFALACPIRLDFSLLSILIKYLVTLLIFILGFGIALIMVWALNVLKESK